MAKIKKLRAVKGAQGDHIYTISITNDGVGGPTNLLKQDITTMRITHLHYSIPSSAGGHIFNWPTHEIDFVHYEANNVSEILLGGDTQIKKGHIAIKDTDFPPPNKESLADNVVDIQNEFILNELEIERDGTGAKVKVVLQSNNGKLYNATTKFRYQEVDSDGDPIFAILLYPEEMVGGSAVITFNTTVTQLANIDNNGVPLFIVNGDPDVDADLPNGMKKRALFWIED